MPEKFRYKAKNKAGEYSEAEIEAETREEALGSLEARGLWVIKLGAAQVKPEPKAVPAPQAVPSKTSSPLKKFLPPVLILIVVGCLVLLSIILRFFDENTSKGPVKFEILSEENSGSRENYDRYQYYVEVERGVTRGDIRKAAEDAYAQAKKENPKLQEATLNFYYHGQKIEEEKPIAVMRWNWNQSKTWEYSFSFESGNSAESFAAKVTVRQTGIEDGKYVAYRFTMPNELTIDAAQKIAQNKIEGMRSQWLQMDEIRADIYYDGFDDPFMKCTLNPKLSGNSRAECKINRL